MMPAVRTITLERSVFADNDRDADALREKMKRAGTLTVNLMGSPGAGKTRFLESLLPLLGARWKTAVLEADIEGDIDAVRLSELGVPSVQIRTLGMCHVDAEMTKAAIDALEGGPFDILFLENVGNLVCPAEFDTGAAMNVMLLSVPEGDDKPLKYPLVFEKSDIVFVSKLDTLPYFTFSEEECVRNIRMRNPRCEIIPLSAKTGKNMELAQEALDRAVRAWKEMPDAGTE